MKHRNIGRGSKSSLVQTQPLLIFYDNFFSQGHCLSALAQGHSHMPYVMMAR